LYAELAERLDRPFSRRAAPKVTVGEQYLCVVVRRLVQYEVCLGRAVRIGSPAVKKIGTIAFGIRTPEERSRNHLIGIDVDLQQGRGHACD